jgi:translation initiation factor 2 subunit 1
MKSVESPEVGELVICTVESINPNSVFVRLDEYDRKGMIHISEIARKWVRDIRMWVKVGQKLVCLVLEADKGISLSLKRVSSEQRNRRMLRWKRDCKGKKFLLEASKKMRASPSTYKEICYLIKEKFKDMLEVFEVGLRGKDVLRERGIPASWADAIANVAKERIKKKEFQLKGILSLRSFAPDGICHIRQALMLFKKAGILVKYISAPKYFLTLKTENPKEGEKIIKETVDRLMQEFKEVECEFKWQK